MSENTLLFTATIMEQMIRQAKDMVQTEQLNIGGGMQIVHVCEQIQDCANGGNGNGDTLDSRCTDLMQECRNFYPDWQDEHFQYLRDNWYKLGAAQ